MARSTNYLLAIEEENALTASWDGKEAVDAVRTGYAEGSFRLQTHLRRERNSILVAEAKRKFREEHHGLFCEACGFDFEAAYGDRGKDFIEAHHILPLAASVDTRETRPEDLAMLCANCHRMVHRGTEILDLPSLKSLVNRSGN